MASPAPNGSYLQQADPQNFPANATGAPPPNNYQAPASTQPEQQGQTPDVPKDEVGWYFVEQYYTTLNKSPDRVHSMMVWGTEGESLPVAHGRADIHEKIAAHEFKDCKVRVSNVDSQASAGNGIVIQVLGEMSNNGLPNRKFSQTFFLAEQTNGYYVLNDIFRYLKDDDDIEEGDEYVYPEDAAAEAVVEAVEEVKEEILEELQDMSIKETSIVEVETADGEKFKVEESVILEPVSELPTEEVSAAVNGSTESIDVPEEAVPEPEEVVEESVPAAPVEEEEVAEERVPTPPVAEEKPTPAPAPVKEVPPTPAPAPVPARPKTWATIASSASSVSVSVIKPVVPAAQAPTTTAAPTAAPVAQTPAPVTAAPAAPATPVTPTTPSGGSQWQTADNKRHSRVNAAPAGQIQAYIKGITDAVPEKALKDALTKYGNLKHFEVIRNKNCAFVDFETPAAFSAANSASPLTVNGVSIQVEERRYGRGNMPNRGDGRPANQGGRGYPPRGDGQRFDGGRGGRGGRGGFARGGAKAATPGN
ncbi:NTF2-domain-containing protein [Wilcoxina mikolae CBS 423.85]|nr:NTF2-domain-containing protein [Wilcoxina mikolae CBS 423.85]